eukprot:CCRYP_003248-RA/>CCRYP_003248-RA protein AED:0.03 eAED:0.03 QI:103/0.66/0.75/1/0.66/0.5/4/3261/415
MSHPNHHIMKSHHHHHHHHHCHPLKHYVMISSILAALSSSASRMSAHALLGHNTQTMQNKRRLFHSLPRVEMMTSGGVDAGEIPPAEELDDESMTMAHYNANGGGDSETWQNPRSRWARRKHRKKVEKQLQRDQASEGDGGQDEDGGALNWESFEFGYSPKMDKRFATNDKTNNNNNENLTGIPQHLLNTIPTDSITYQTYLQSESNLDQLTSHRLAQSQSQLLSLSPQLVQRSIDILSPYVQPRRLERIHQVLQQRTKHARFLFENPSNPSNVWACLRTLDSFGIQYVDVIVDSDEYQGKAAVNQKRGMRTAMVRRVWILCAYIGSACWMTLRQFGSTEEAISILRDQEGCLIYASDLNPDSMDVRDLNWDVDLDHDGLEDDDNVNINNNNVERTKQRPICIVMGNEERGISEK